MGRVIPIGPREVEVILDDDLLERHGLIGQSPPTMNKLYINAKGNDDDLVSTMLHEAYHKGSYLFTEETLTESNCRVCSEVTVGILKRIGVFTQVVNWIKNGANEDIPEKGDN